MGEMADFSLEQVGDWEDLVSEYHSGNMSVHEAYEHGIVDELGFEHKASTTKTCKFCGATNLQWKVTETGWRLFSGAGELHECEKYTCISKTIRYNGENGGET